jgi:hypothetical protein
MLAVLVVAVLLLWPGRKSRNLSVRNLPIPCNEAAPVAVLSHLTGTEEFPEDTIQSCTG